MHACACVYKYACAWVRGYARTCLHVCGWPFAVTPTTCWARCMGITPADPSPNRYASLYFCVGIDAEDNELLALEIIHRYVELLDECVLPRREPNSRTILAAGISH